jgi:phospholipase C
VRRPKLLPSISLLICVAGGLLTLNVCGGGGAANTTAAPVASITASPNAIPAGQSVMLSWQTSNATSVSIQGLGTVAASGSQKVTPASSTDYQLTATGPGGMAKVAAQVTVTTTPIEHVVIIFQENRSVDNLFGSDRFNPNGRQLPNADIADFGINSHGDLVPLTAVSIKAPYNPDHSRIPAFQDMCDISSSTGNCKMDGADKIQIFCDPGKPNCAPPNPQFKYVQGGDVQPYFQMAETYTFGDRMFQTNQGPSFPAHQFIISGTSAPSAGSDLFVAENPTGIDTGVSKQKTGCIAAPEATVLTIDPNGIETPVYPCLDHPTLTDELNTSQLSWRYYAPSDGSIWTGPNAIQHMCGPNATPPNATACTGSDWSNVVLQNSSNDVHTPNAVLADISSGKLATVTWVIPSGEASDHPRGTDGSGPTWVSQIVNAIGNSPYWANTAIIITWDDWGGWYDHVPPPAILNAYEFGFRVPLIVVSPYAKPQYVSHQVYDFGSIMKFIEKDFGLSTVAAGYADTFTLTGDLMDCFNFSQQPLVFKTIVASAPSRFKHTGSPPSDPDDD